MGGGWIARIVDDPNVTATPCDLSLGQTQLDRIYAMDDFSNGMYISAVAKYTGNTIGGLTDGRVNTVNALQDLMFEHENYSADPHAFYVHMERVADTLEIYGL